MKKIASKKASEKQFGKTFSLFFVFLTLFFFKNNNDFYLATICISFILFIITFFRPSLFFYPNTCWIKLGLILEKIISPLFLFIVFFGLFLPLNLFLKVIKKDLLKTKINSKIKSYWTNNSTTATDFTKQF